MKMSLQVDSPCWLMRLGGSQVGGVEHANFLLLEIDADNMKRQLQGFMSELMKMQPEHMVSVSTVEMDADNFRYGGFIKSILDMISLGTEDRWDIVIRLKECKAFYDGDGNEQRASISIRRGEEEWPLIGPDRDAAFYALVLCYTAEKPEGVKLSGDFPHDCVEQKRYKQIYSMMSIRDEKDCPDIYHSDLRRPIISRINLAINPEEKKSTSKLLDGTNYLTERELYEVAKSQNRFYVVLNPSNVIVRQLDGYKTIERPLKESALYKSVISIRCAE